MYKVREGSGRKIASLAGFRVGVLFTRPPAPQLKLAFFSPPVPHVCFLITVQKNFQQIFPKIRYFTNQSTSHGQVFLSGAPHTNLLIPSIFPFVRIRSTGKSFDLRPPAPPVIQRSSPGSKILSRWLCPAVLTCCTYRTTSPGMEEKAELSA